jgi:transcriptional regulator with XRE-family HTH domain
MAWGEGRGYALRMPDKPLTPDQVASNKRLLTYVKAWLKFRARTQRELAEALNLSEPTISKWLRGHVSVTVAQFCDIAAFLETSPEELMGAPPAADKARRYRRIADVAQDMPDDALEEWLALGRRLAGKAKPG